ncbi:DUF2892 domain-containing protein [Caldicellulosiruptor changbaiensis]|uniref:DUF2892 domain-containing protein n=1 Tax=Caldicellulosiruptor changbaiensis TaxID=1222016 RepID=A0A3T0D3F7_9FIRM|nr:DUF2892 domain-containing protein [Caldicellulosiruptor changbaiensis]AZT89210.1 DUF2892 domain-containing protein [Caldicellulosiruptor changbaiensis]
MKNVGPIDKAIRIILGLVLLSLLFIVKSNAKYFGLIGIIPLITGFIGYCPLYSIFGINTLKKKR